MPVLDFDITDCQPMYQESSITPFFRKAEANQPTRILCKAFAFEYHCSLLGAVTDISTDAQINPAPEGEEARLTPPRVALDLAELTTMNEMPHEDWLESAGDLIQQWEGVRESWNGNPPRVCDLVRSSTVEELGNHLAKAPFLYLVDLVSRGAIRALLNWAYHKAPASLSQTWKWTQFDWAKWVFTRVDWKYIATKLKHEEWFGQDHTRSVSRYVELLRGRPGKKGSRVKTGRSFSTN